MIRTLLHRSIASQLERICEASQSTSVLERHGKDESHHACIPPQIVVFPESLEQVQAVVKVCNENRVALVAFGTGTSLEGHIQALEGGVCLDTSKLNRIIEENVDDGDALVEAGVTRGALNASLRASGVQMMVDPGADASLGGMAACGASGTMAVRYGTMRENVLGMTAVLANGDVVKLGGRARKSSAGYDLSGLMVGSEGTLGVITELRVRVHPVPARVAAATVSFPSGGVRAAADAVVALLNVGMQPRRCELLDKETIVAFNRYHRDSRETSATLFLEFADVTDVALASQLELAHETCEDFGGVSFESSTDEDHARRLWAARHHTYYAALALKPNGRALVTDACVPLSNLADCVDATVADVKASGVVGPVFGHAGDGNFHCILVHNDDDDEAYMDALKSVNDRIVRRALDAGGTCTGEHGVGVGKKPYLRLQYGDATVDAMTRLKAALDPRGILNPGKIV